VRLSYLNGKDKEEFHFSDFNCPEQNKRLSEERLFRIVWVLEDEVDFIVDTVPLKVQANEMIFFTPHHEIELVTANPKLRSLGFNREFYCISDNDEEVSCYGHLFYGSSAATLITLCTADQQRIESLFEVFKEEFEYTDHIQGEMLRMLLKRLLIKSSRLARESLVEPQIKDSQLDVVRKFNVLVEKHFKEKHQVKEYADLLFKSPKTLSNLFAKYNDLTPLQVINERIVLEAKRRLAHTQKTIEELAYELGYSDAAHFSKFFKKQTGSSPNSFKKSLQD